MKIVNVTNNYNDLITISIYLQHTIWSGSKQMF